MGQDLLALIGKMTPQFSKGQRLIANYMINHFDKAGVHDRQQAGAARWG